MHGEYKIRVRNSKNSYSFSLKRNITILKGESGRGKTTLFEMIQEYNRFGKNSGVTMSCDREVVAVSGERWEDDILNKPGSIIVIDEDSHFIKSNDFAKIVKNSDNYFLIITRNYLYQLPISVDEIYELNGNKNKRFKKIYTHIDRMYDAPHKERLPFKPDVVITEDSGAAYQFFSDIACECGIECISAGGKSKILHELCKHLDKNVVVIADGAAFGAEMSDVVQQQMLNLYRIAIYLPESFEWIIMESGVVKVLDKEQIESPEEYADSVKYMSWEQYFTSLLMELTSDSAYSKYNKRKLTEFYLQDRVKQIIIRFIKGIDFGDNSN